MLPPSSSRGARGAGGSSRGGRLVLAMCVVNFVVALDFLGASVLLNEVGRDLDLSNAQLTWIVNGYLLTLAAPLIAVGRLADRIGPVRLTRIGLAIFATGAALTGFANSLPLLIGGRVVQGLGASVLTATGLSLVSSSVASPQRGRTVGLWAAVGAVGSAAGPLVAGSVAAASSWRGFFLMDIPLVVVAIGLLGFRRVDSGGTTDVAIGYRAVGALTLGLAAGVFALLQAPDDGWSSPAVVLAAFGSVAFLAWFGLLEQRAEHPLLDRRVFLGGEYAAIAGAALIGNAAFAVVSFFASLYLQQVLELSAFETGLCFLALTIPLALCSPLVGRAVGRSHDGALLAAGLVAIAISVALFAVFPAHSGLAVVLTALAVSGVGQAVVFNITNVQAMNQPTGVAVGTASGVINEVRQLGALVGLATVGALFGALRSGARGGPKEAFVGTLGPPSVLLAGVCAATAVAAFRRIQR